MFSMYVPREGRQAKEMPVMDREEWGQRIAEILEAETGKFERSMYFEGRISDLKVRDYSVFELKAAFAVGVDIQIEIEWAFEKEDGYFYPSSKSRDKQMCSFRTAVVNVEIATSGTSRDLIETTALVSLLQKALTVGSYIKMLSQTAKLVKWEEVDN